MVVSLTYCNSLLVEGQGCYSSCTGCKQEHSLMCTGVILANVLSRSLENTPGVKAAAGAPT